MNTNINNISINSSKDDIATIDVPLTINYGSFPSSDQETTIEFLSIVPKSTPTGILHFVHGMAEHKERYVEFGKFMAKNNIAFFMADNLGHGKSITDEEKLGYLGPCPDGWQYIVKDAKTLTDYIKESYPNVPYTLAGHSMGSFLVRAYASFFPQEADKLIFMGTGMANGVAKLGKTLANVIGKFKGSKHRSKTLEKATFGPYIKAVENPNTTFDWLSYDSDNIKNYIDDPLCGFTFTTNGYANLSDLLVYVSAKSTIAKYNKDTPIYIISGKEDAVGNNGSSILALEKMLIDTDIKNVTVTLYDNMRHEILNEKEKEKVYNDLLNFVK